MSVHTAPIGDPRCRRRVWLPACLAAVLVLGAAGRAGAQQQWFHYKAGMDAVKAQEWTVAIDAFTKALAIDKVPGFKASDGVQTEPYFPHLYLALAYARTKQWNLAAGFLKIALKGARDFGPDEKRLQPDLEEEIRVALLDPRFGEAAARADAACAAKRYAEAIRHLQEAQAYDDGKEFAKRKLNDRLREAAAGYRDEIQARVASARALLGNPSTLDEARTILLAIEQRLADEKDIAGAVTGLPRPELAEALKTVVQREGEYRALLGTAGQADTAGRLQEARAAYAKAAGVWPQQAARDKVADRQNAVQARLAYAEGRFDEAVRLATAVIDSDGTRQDMRALRARAESRLAFREGVAARDQRRYAEAERKFGEAVEKDRDHGEAASALEALREFAALMQQARALGLTKKYAEALDALARLEAKDPVRFEAEALGALRQALDGERKDGEFQGLLDQVRKLDDQKRWADAIQALDRLRTQDAARYAALGGPALREAVLTHEKEAKAAATSAAQLDLQAATRHLEAEEIDAACAILERLREVPGDTLPPADQANARGYLGIAYFVRSQDKARAAEKTQWEDRAIVVFREALKASATWEPPEAFGRAVRDFFNARVRQKHVGAGADLLLDLPPRAAAVPGLRPTLARHAAARGLDASKGTHSARVSSAR